MAFTGPLIVRHQDDRHWILDARLPYDGRTQEFIVPAGFTTDFASVPRPLFSVIPHTTGVLAAVLHDWFCVGLAEGWCPVSAVDADRIFRRVLRECGVPFVTRWLMFVGVRWGALLNPHRRAGWWRDAPVVLGTSGALLAALWFVYALVTGTL
ncbi:DUF1353 domain-containing protein [Blastococcus mobilis]|uniref:DUF1353 domain-containing protein n=1 Tax=Blastococcus mobilis TaxID=1938746 RepID=A0A238VY69_9ACTN|nr:DUF1353 domain-containing protein [Blastococcus mobilis]SNR38803.1 Protein of unknown function [Blastococcus mobilis]